MNYFIENPQTLIAAERISEMNIRNKSLLSHLRDKTFLEDINLEVPAPTFGYGVEEAFRMLQAKRDLERVDDYSEGAELPKQAGEIYGFLDTSDNSFFAMWDRYGMFRINTAEVLFETPLIPVNLDFTHTKEDLEKNIWFTATRLVEELEDMKITYDNPLFLISRDTPNGTNAYVAWSLTENEPVLVLNYKGWRKGFTAEPLGSEATIPSEEYDVIPPSKELIQALKLNLNPGIWEKLLSRDKWEPRPLVTETDEDIPEEYYDLYQRALNLLNKQRQEDLGFREEFERLEARFDRVNSFLKFKGPKPIVDDAFRLLNNIVEKLNII